mgnify:CR=1 FL=1
MDDKELADHVSKAVSSQETAPKPKHVRACIVSTWERRSSNAFWQNLKLCNVHSDEIQSFKALLTIHKVLRDGHPSSLVDGYREIPYIESLANYTQRPQRSYSPLIKSYAAFLKTKLQFHNNRKEFSGNMSYEDYISLKQVSNLNEGFDTVSTLMDFMNNVLELAQKVFKSFNQNSNNECRIASFVPLVEEANGIFLFMTSMLKAMHATVADISGLEPLRDRYNEQYRPLYKFFFDCQSLRYLTSLIAVPQLDPVIIFIINLI